MTTLIHLFTRPAAAWDHLAAAPTVPARTAAHMLLFALLPALAWYWGATEVGWSIVGEHKVRMTTDTAAVIVVLFYGAMVGGLVAIGLMLHWMADTYGANSSPARALQLVAWTATPLFLAGACGFYPMLWLDLLLGTAAAGWTFYLLVLGIPRMMAIPPERGQLFAAAVLAVGLVLFVGLLGTTVMLWELGAMPEFTD